MPKKNSKGRPKGGAKSSRRSPEDAPELAGGARWLSPRFAAAAVGGAALAAGWTRFLAQNDVGGGGGGETEGHPLSSRELLARVRKSRSFELTTSGGTRTLSATADIPANTVLMEIPRELMVWDLDAARDEFVRKELLNAPLFEGQSADVMSKRAALLSAYLALLRNDIAVSADNPRGKSLQASVAKALPSYEDYASFHPVLADLREMKRYLGKKSISYLHLVHVRRSLQWEYDMLGPRFATYISREDYLACRLAVQSRSFQLTDVSDTEISKEERGLYKQKLGIDFRNAVVSIEPVNDWMNTHSNNNVRVGGYDAEKQLGRAWTTKPIRKGQELINNYGEFYNHVLFSQYGFVPADGTGTSIASLFAHHDINLMGELMGESNPTLPSLEKMASYLRYDYGYDQCITEETNPHAFNLKRLKLDFLQQIAIDPSRWVLPLPPRSSTDETPFSTASVPDVEKYEAPAFGADIYEYLEQNALSASLPCRLIALTEQDRPDAVALLREDLRRLRGSSTPHQTPPLLLEELEISLSWFARTLQCIVRLTSLQSDKSKDSVAEQEQYILSLVASGNVNTLEWNAAHVRLEEMQSQGVLKSWASGVLDKVRDIEGIVPNDMSVREDPCPEEYTEELIF